MNFVIHYLIGVYYSSYIVAEAFVAVVAEQPLFWRGKAQSLGLSGLLGDLETGDFETTLAGLMIGEGGLKTIDAKSKVRTHAIWR